MVDASKMRPAPPVAKMVTFDWKIIDLAGFHFDRGDTDNMAVFVTDQVERHPLDEELGMARDVALVHRVQQA